MPLLGFFLFWESPIIGLDAFKVKKTFDITSFSTILLKKSQAANVPAPALSV